MDVEAKRFGSEINVMNIYVGNLSWEVTEDELRQAFESFGQVTSVSIITDKYSGRSRGFGFIEMPTETEAKAAISGLNGTLLRDRAVNVSEARPHNEGRRTGWPGGGRRRHN